MSIVVPPPCIKDLSEKLDALEGITVSYGVSLAKRVSMKVGGPAEILVSPRTSQSVVELYRLLEQFSVPITILGGGTNIIIADEGIVGVVLDLEPGFNYLREHPNEDGSSMWEVGAGAGTGRVVNLALQRGLAGPEVLAGVPGTMGGALIMNAGGHEGEIKTVVERVLIADKGQLRWLSNREVGFSYRSSAFPSGAIILGCELRLTPGNTEALKSQVKQVQRRRRMTQPLQFPNAGSIFKNPPGDYAGRLIEQAGCKGLQQGKAQVSELHANFIINLGGAKASDIMTLANIVRQKVFEKTDVKLELEVKLLGGFSSGGPQ